MIANAEQAVEKLRHARTGEVLPSKIIDRNTRLVYLDDEMVGLRFHDTIIARYLRDGVLIDTRDPLHPSGWFTVTTWNRIDAWTPARTYTRYGLRHLMLDPSAGWDGPSRLYAHGSFVSSDGSCEIPLAQETSDAITEIKRIWPSKLKRHANRAVRAWRDWGEPRDCCKESFGHLAQHYVKHIERGETFIPPDIDGFADPLRERMLQGDVLCGRLEQVLADDFREELIPLAIARVAPDFPYPQLQRRRR